jgi:hypothetical protein
VLAELHWRRHYGTLCSGTAAGLPVTFAMYYGMHSRCGRDFVYCFYPASHGAMDYSVEDDGFFVSASWYGMLN